MLRARAVFQDCFRTHKDRLRNKTRKALFVRVQCCCVSASCRVPLIVHALLDAPAAASSHPDGEYASNDTRILLLAAVPYLAGVATHIVNALHSHKLNERRCANGTGHASG